MKETNNFQRRMNEEEKNCEIAIRKVTTVEINRETKERKQLHVKAGSWINHHAPREKWRFPVREEKHETPPFVPEKIHGFSHN